MAWKQKAFFHALFISRLADQILPFLVPLVVSRLRRASAGLERHPSWRPCPGFVFPRLPLAMRPDFLLAALACKSIPSRAGVHRRHGGLFARRRCGLADRDFRDPRRVDDQGLMAREVMLPQAFSLRRSADRNSKKCCPMRRSPTNWEWFWGLWPRDSRLSFGHGSRSWFSRRSCSWSPTPP